MEPSPSAQLSEALAALDRDDFARALELLVPLATNGDPRAKARLADLYMTGSGVESSGKKAAQLYLEAAEQGINEQQLAALAYYNLSVLYITGASDLKPDPKKASHFARRASDAGF